MRIFIKKVPLSKLPLPIVEEEDFSVYDVDLSEYKQQIVDRLALLDKGRIEYSFDPDAISYSLDKEHLILTGKVVVTHLEFVPSFAAPDIE